MRQIRQSDALALAELIRATGLDDNPDPERIARVSLESNHLTLVETGTSGALIGFVDAFLTVSASGVLRWEVDLLGVHPAHRGRGVAASLVAEAVRMGFALGAEMARALVRVENIPSLRAFVRCGFRMADAESILYVSDQEATTSPPIPSTSGYLIPVSTLTYSGVWIQGEQSPEALRCAQAVRTKYGWDVAGAVMAADAPVPVGYRAVGRYRWLTLRK